MVETQLGGNNHDSDLVVTAYEVGLIVTEGQNSGIGAEQLSRVSDKARLAQGSDLSSLLAIFDEYRQLMPELVARGKGQAEASGAEAGESALLHPTYTVRASAVHDARGELSMERGLVLIFKWKHTSALHNTQRVVWSAYHSSALCPLGSRGISPFPGILHALPPFLTTGWCRLTADCYAIPGCDGEFVECDAIQGKCYRGNGDGKCSTVQNGQRYARQKEEHWCHDGRSTSYCPIPASYHNFPEFLSAEATRNGSTMCLRCPSLSSPTYVFGDTVCGPCAHHTYYQEVVSAIGVRSNICQACPQCNGTVLVGAMSQEKCVPACDVGHFSEQGVGPCVECPRGKFQDTCLQTSCKLCPAQRALTLETKSVHINACYFAEIGVERVWRSSRVLNLQVYWKLVPAAFARVGDKIALFKGSILQTTRRQLAWSYTSTQSYITDNADLQPGDTALNEGSRTFRFNSAGEGTYMLYFYLSMSPPLVHAFAQNGGNIVAEHAFNLSEHASDNSTFQNALTYDLGRDMGDRICHGGLVCPDGTGALPEYISVLHIACFACLNVILHITSRCT
jgi:hypothetical protein